MSATVEQTPYNGGPHLLDDPTSANLDLSAGRFHAIYGTMSQEDIDAVAHWSDKDRLFAWLCKQAHAERVEWESTHRGRFPGVFLQFDQLPR